MSAHRAVRIFLEELYLLLLPLTHQPEHRQRWAEMLGETLAAGERLGLIEPEEAETWRRRIARMGSRRRRRPSPEVRDRGRAYLETADRSSLLRLHGAVTAFEHVGILNHHRGFDWRQNKLRMDDPEWERQAYPDFRARGEARVLRGPEARVSGIRVLSVAIFDDGFVLTTQRDPFSAGAARDDLQLEFLSGDSMSYEDEMVRVVDDLGHRYRWSSSGGVSNGFALDAIVTTVAQYRPAPPPEATRLELRTPQGALRIDLRED
jgi:hypothetical protein